MPAIIRCGMRARSATTAAPLMSLPSASASRPVCFCTSSDARISDRIHGLAPGIRHLDADDVPTRHGGDAHRSHREAAGHVIGQADHARAADAGRGLQFVQRHHRTGTDLHDVALHAVIGEHRLQQPGVGLQRLGCWVRCWRGPERACSSESDGKRQPASDSGRLSWRGRRSGGAGRAMRDATTGGGSSATGAVWNAAGESRRTTGPELARRAGAGAAGGRGG